MPYWVKLIIWLRGNLNEQLRDKIWYDSLIANEIIIPNDLELVIVQWYTSYKSYKNMEMFYDHHLDSDPPQVKDKEVTAGPSMIKHGMIGPVKVLNWETSQSFSEYSA